MPPAALHPPRALTVAGVGRDISERKKNEKALREAEQKYRSMFDEALVGIFKLGPDGRLLYVNPAMAACMAYTSPEEMPATITTSLWTTAVSPERSAEVMTMIQAAGHVRSFEVEVFRKDGSKIWISSGVRVNHQNLDRPWTLHMCVRYNCKQCRHRPSETEPSGWF